MGSLPKTLVTGARGMVGSYIDFGIKTDQDTLDITDLKAVISAVKKHQPKVIIHLAALTSPEVAEKNPSLAYLVNTIGTYNVALAARNAGAKLVYVSSTGVFDGTKKGPYTEKDLPNPTDFYGHSKYAGELIAQSMLKNYIIARTCWIFGGGPAKDKKFVSKIIEQINNPKTIEIKAVNDVKGSPTFAKDLVEALKKLIARDAKGIFHLTNKGAATRFDIAKTIVDSLKPSIKLTGVPSDYFGRHARRVVNESAVSRVDLMRPWQEALVEYIRSEWK